MLGDDVLLAHSIDEAIVLARDLSTQLQYSSAARPSVLGPLTAQPVFSRWLNMERKAAFRDHAGRAAAILMGILFCQLHSQREV